MTLINIIEDVLSWLSVGVLVPVSVVSAHFSAIKPLSLIFPSGEA